MRNTDNGFEDEELEADMGMEGSGASATAGPRALPHTGTGPASVKPLPRRHSSARAPHRVQ
ncbi:hypothetical protein GCM10011415_35130 [Salipiger pallidus]|uniref:Uncharacterized protein n=1 Tax=Salipiger pallidus TaxID=1775170 RepID=A0A8J3EIN5_9RHOB|nr:hypothetical protein GCM10011415_35130 [Salipiger pallidus]